MAKLTIINSFTKCIYIAAPILVIGAVLCYIYYVFSLTPEEFKLNLHNVLISSLLTILSNLVLAVIAFGGLFLTSRSIKANTSSAQRQATIQVVMDINADRRLQDTKNLIFLKENKITDYYIALSVFTELDVSMSNQDKENDRKQVLENEKLKDDIHYVLNRYEFIALGIRKGAFEEEMFKDLHYSSFKKLWRYTKPLIMKIRIECEIYTIYQELEGLMKKWEANPIKKLE